MTWWRRDPSISPVNRYAQRLLRSHESALRSRCFSRTPAQEAQHEDNDGNKRPSGMSNLEWMQMQHYNRWRKRFTDDPYQALFGASHDMLRGKGLGDWEWISKTFPKWMLTEMETEEDRGNRPTQQNNTENNSHPRKRGENGDETDVSSRRRESLFPQPSIRATRLDRDDFTGIASPSDLRRPREHSHYKVVGRQSSTLPTSGVNVDSISPQPKTPEQSRPEPPQVVAEIDQSTSSSNKKSFEEAENPEMSYLEQFLAEEQQHHPHPRRSIWRQTTLDRRSASLPATTSKKRAMPTNAAEVSHAASRSTVESEQTVENATRHSYLGESARNPDKEDVLSTSHARSHTIQPEYSASRQMSTSDILKQLPKDDIDFLSADDIRASMGSKRARSLTTEEKRRNRQNLESTFKHTHEVEQNLNPMIESQIVNDQHIRRLERELQTPQTPQLEPTYSRQTGRSEAIEEPVVPEPPIEGTIDRLINLVSSHFWQTPAEPENLQKTRAFFEQFLSRVRRGRNAIKQIIEDLENDVPASKKLLKLLQEHDDVLDSTVRKVQKRLDSGDRKATLSNQKTNQRLRDQIRHTDIKLEAAFALLNETEVPKIVLPSFKRRLQTASRVATKNLELTRQMAWGLQTHLEDPEIDRTILSGYQAVANTLLVVKHTQLAFTLLLDRALQIYGVSKALADSAVANSARTDTPSSITNDAAPIANKEFAQSEPTEEVLISNTLGQRNLEESPLVHSLFRPFGPVIESLGKDMEAVKAEEIENEKARDAKLVADVQQAYEDTYGPITVDHKQISDASEPSESEAKANAKAFEMLKEDDVSGVSFKEQATTFSLRPEATVTTPQSEIVEANTTENSASSATSADNSPSATALPLANAPPMDLPTHYTILVHDPETGKLSVTTSVTGPPRDSTPAVPLHQALATLSYPAKFVPFITEGLEVQSAGPYMLVLRDAINDTSSTRSFETVSALNVHEPTETSRANESSTVNPIDGTTRLSPTGYVGPEESQEQLEKEFEERRQAADRYSNAQNVRLEEQSSAKQEPKKKRRAGGVMKTAIWAAAVCYVAGVIGEIAS